MLDDQSDWRLPNVNELKSIVDGSKYNPAIKSAFTKVRSGAYWSSTTDKRSKHLTWTVIFRNGGGENYASTIQTLSVRCVRAGQ